MKYAYFRSSLPIPPLTFIIGVNIALTLNSIESMGSIQQTAVFGDDRESAASSCADGTFIAQMIGITTA